MKDDGKGSTTLTAEEVLRSLERNDGYYKTLWNAVIDDFLPMLPDNPRILDLGCGPGGQSRIMTSKGADVVGIDIDEGMLTIARELSPEGSFYNMDIRNLSHELGKFDCIFSSMVLISLEVNELPSIFGNLYSLLNRNGYFVVITNRKHCDRETFLQMVEQQGFMFVRDGYMNDQQQSIGWISCIFKVS